MRIDDDRAQAISVRRAIEVVPGLGNSGALAGIQASKFELGAALTLHVQPAQVYAFDASGALLVAPQRREVH